MQEQNTPPNRAELVARFILKLSASEAEPEYLSHMQLQKLLYFTQAWSLVFRERALFDERFEAWTHGPVVYSVYKTFSKYSNSPIPFEEADGDEGLSEREKLIIESVWRHYGRFSAPRLRKISHRKGGPWHVARTGLKPDDNSHEEIPQDTIKAYFSDEFSRKPKQRDFNLDEIRRAEQRRDCDERGIKLEDAISRLRHAV